MRCKCCVYGPDHDDVDTNKIHNDAWWHQFYNECGNLLYKYEQAGIPRLIKLKFIRYTQQACSHKFRNGAGTVGDLMRKLKKAGNDLVLKGNEIEVFLVRGEFWSFDSRRLYCMKNDS